MVLSKPIIKSDNDEFIIYVSHDLLESLYSFLELIIKFVCVDL